MFLSCGDALFDVFETQHGDAQQVSLSAHIGGSPLNVALGLARLGNPVEYLTANSTDALGQKLQAFMTSENIGTQHVVRTDKNTSLAMVSLNSDGHPSYAFYIEGSADVSLSLDDLPDPTPFEAISLGSYSTVVKPIADSLKALVHRAAANTVIAFDPNVRPSIEPNPDVWWETFNRIAPLSDIIKLSDEDIEFLSPGSSIERFVREALALGAEWVVVTRGPDGAIAHGQSGQVIQVPGRKVAVVDTVGAGDTFQAAMLDALKRNGWLKKSAIANADMRVVLEWAIAAAAVTCSRKGANLPSHTDVQETLA